LIRKIIQRYSYDKKKKKASLMAATNTYKIFGELISTLLCVIVEEAIYGYYLIIIYIYTTARGT
jgi:hypothetical protein